MSDHSSEDVCPISEWPLMRNSLSQDVRSENQNADTTAVEYKRSHEGDKNSGSEELPCKIPRSQDILTADVALARWWRRHGRRLISPTILPKSQNPSTILNYVQRTDIAQEFLKGEVLKLKTMAIDRNDILNRDSSSELNLALASYYEKLGDLNKALNAVDKALSLDPKAKPAMWLSAKLKRQQAMKIIQEEKMNDLKPTPEEPLVFPKYTKIRRRSCKELSFKEFHMEYSKTHTPVIITDYLPLITSTPWNLDHIKTKAGQCNVTLKKFVDASVEWARLESDKTSTVAEFIDSISGDKDRNCEKLYLFDWSLPLHCPDLAKELTIPQYFAGDFLQRSSEGSLYKDSWPSLFIAPKGLTTELHVDAFGSSFWMALFQGRKRWVFFPREDRALLYPQYPHSMDPVFDADLETPDMLHQPLLSLTHPMECVLEPGELLFVPSGCPHRVENLETSLAISANFVDLSNFHTVLEELKINALVDPRAENLLEQFGNDRFVRKMKSQLQDLPWEKFKQWPPDTLEDYDLTC